MYLPRTKRGTRASQVALLAKNLLLNAGDIRHVGLIPGSGRSHGGGHATHFRILAWRIPCTEKPDGLLFLGSKESDMTERLSRHEKEKQTFTSVRYGSLLPIK